MITSYGGRTTRDVGNPIPCDVDGIEAAEPYPTATTRVTLNVREQDGNARRAIASPWVKNTRPTRWDGGIRGDTYTNQERPIIAWHGPKALPRWR